MIRLAKEILEDGAFEVFASIESNPTFKDFYLAGGTALALQLGHRKSTDFDFFTSIDFKTNILSKLGYEYEVMSCFDNSIEIVACLGFRI